MDSRYFVLGTVLGLSLLATGCGTDSTRYPNAASSEEEREELCADEIGRILVLENQLEEARTHLDSLEQRKNQLQSAADDLRANVDRLAAENWQHVVPDIDASASDVEDEASQMDKELSDATDVLQDR